MGEYFKLSLFAILFSLLSSTAFTPTRPHLAYRVTAKVAKDHVPLEATTSQKVFKEMQNGTRVGNGETNTEAPLSTKVPGHMAFIVDGNGRWATRRGLPRTEGHRRGANATVEIARSAFEAGVKTVSLYLFSAENWNRPVDEVVNIMSLLEKYLGDFLPYLLKNRIRLCVIGDCTRIPDTTRELLRKIEFDTQSSSLTSDLTLCLALSYSGRQEIVAACRDISRRVAAGAFSPEQIDTQVFADATDTGRQGIPDPDCVVRTSGEQRLSNFLLWQSAYAEFISIEDMWPDFTSDRLRDVLAEYSVRARRFGRLEAS